MRIAIPTSDGYLDEHFGHCREFTMIESNGEIIQRITRLYAPEHSPGVLPSWLAEKGVTDVIAGGMGNRAIEVFQQLGIQVYLGAPKDSPEVIASGFLDQSLRFSGNLCDQKSHGGHPCHH